MKKLLIFTLLFGLFACTTDSSLLNQKIIKRFNENAPEGQKATDLMLINKKGNEYVGLLETQDSLQLVLSVFSDEKDFFYWVIDGQETNVKMDAPMEIEVQEVSMENFPKEIVGTWSYNCQDLENNPFEYYSIEITEIGIGGIEFAANIIDIEGKNGRYKLSVTIMDIYTDQAQGSETWNLEIVNGRLIIDGGKPLNKCQ